MKNILSCNNAVASATIQINGYLAEPIIAFEKLPNPIQYWKNYRDCELRTVALKYLIVPATSVSSERTASSAGNTVTAARSCLTAEHVDELVFINKNSYLLDLE
jgi:hypothetical protein